MAIKYTKKQTENLGLVFEYIERETEDGIVSFIPKDPTNSDYQRYLRWLENPDAEESGTLS